ncbi:MAG: hypothetical protein WAN50_02430 [Minisyncoccia bacterium]
MSAKAYDKKTAAFAGFMIQNFPDTLTDEIMDGWMNNPAATKKFLAGLVPPESATAPAALLSASATTELAVVVGKPTKKCFTASRYAYRDSDFDGWLPKEQPEAAACTITTLTPSRDATFAQWAAFVLGVPADTSIEKLAALLIERGHTMTLAQAEAMVEATESKPGNTGMRTDGWANWFFVEDKNGSVSVAGVNRGDSRWNADVSRLGNDDRWDADDRLLVRNLDASKLGS